MAANESFDVVVLGATGFTGQLACEYLASAKAPPGLRWAMAGRNLQKLEDFRRTLPSAGTQVPLLQVDVGNEAQLKELAASTKVIANYAGSPYWDKGLPVVAACAASGCHYVDITGEPPFVKSSIDRYHDKAQETGALIVHCCGFDSVPSDLAAWLAAKTMRERHGVQCSKMRFVAGKMHGGASGGTIHTMLSMFSDRSTMENAQSMFDPYALDPAGSLRGPDTQDFGDRGVLPGWDATAGCWGVPFTMAPPNARIVRRSNALSGHAYGASMSYGEIMEVSGPMAAYGAGTGMGLGLAAVAVPPVRWGLKRWILPEPGQGPSRQMQNSGFFEVRTIAVGEATAEPKPRVTVHVKSGSGGDPGYKCTALMSVEAALCCALQRSLCHGPGGVLTPAVAFGQVLVDRLTLAGMSFFAEPEAASRL